MSDQNIKLKNVSFAQDLISTRAEPVKRKRGRPRKNQVVNKSAQKRGRKPKNIVQKKPRIFIKKKEEEDIILHLPINTTDIHKYSKINTPFHKDRIEQDKSVRSAFKNRVSPKHKVSSYQNSLGLVGGASSGSGAKQDKSYCDTSNIFTITSASNSDSSEDYNSNEDTTELIKQLKQKDKLVQKLQSENNEYRSIMNNSEMIGVNNRTATKMNTEFINIIDNKPVIIEKTDIACWWCAHTFDTMPYFIPEKYYHDKYYVYGCFCSLPCTAAYILDNNDYNVWNRYSLLKKLYNLGTTHHILPAPSNKVFKKFGGNLSIEEYRKNNNTQKKDYRLVMPPLATIVPLIESGYVDSSKYNRLRMYNSKDHLVLKRSKPLPNSRNTLLETMKLKNR